MCNQIFVDPVISVKEAGSKGFASFVEGITEVMQLFPSLGQALDAASPGGGGSMHGMDHLIEVMESASYNLVVLDWEVERVVKALLISQVFSSRENKPGFYWNRSKQGSFQYRTSRGLAFGWEYVEGAGWLFFVTHPSGSFPEGSTLRESLEWAEWDILPANDVWRWRNPAAIVN